MVRLSAVKGGGFSLLGGRTAVKEGVWRVIRGKRGRTGRICGEKYPDKCGTGPRQPSRGSPRHKGTASAYAFHIRQNHPFIDVPVPAKVQKVLYYFMVLYGYSGPRFFG
jgi:hypothetical protein